VTGVDVRGQPARRPAGSGKGGELERQVENREMTQPVQGKHGGGVLEGEEGNSMFLKRFCRSVGTQRVCVVRWCQQAAALQRPEARRR